MGYNLNLVSEEDRYQYLNKKFGIKNIIYMGDGIYDAKILSDCYYGISPKNSRTEAKKSSDFITKNRSAEGAVLDACLHIDKKFFKKI